MAGSTAAHPRDPFGAWLKRIPVLYGLVTVALGAVLGVLAPDRFVPEPLGPYRMLGSVIVLTAFVLTWAWQEWIRAHLRIVGGATFVLLICFVMMNVLFVRAVPFRNPPDTEYYLVGTSVADERLEGLSDADIIRQVGGDRGTLARVYRHFSVVALSYALCYLLLVHGLVLAIGGSDLARLRST